jgi:hypothetical protein
MCLFYLNCLPRSQTDDILINVNLPSDPRMRLRAILIIIVLATIPFYCVGLVAIMVVPDGGKIDQTPTFTVSPTSTFNLSVTPVLNTLTPSLTSTNTATPTQTGTPTITPTLFVPPSWTPSITSTPTWTMTFTLVPPTATFTSTSTLTDTPVPPTPTATETPTPP